MLKTGSAVKMNNPARKCGLKIAYMLLLTMVVQGAELTASSLLSEMPEITWLASRCKVSLQSADKSKPINANLYSEIIQVLNADDRSIENLPRKIKYMRLLDGVKTDIIFELSKFKNMDADELIIEFCYNKSKLDPMNPEPFIKHCIRRLFPPVKKDDILEVKIPKATNDLFVVEWKYTRKGSWGYGGQVRFENRIRHYERYFVPVEEILSFVE